MKLLINSLIKIVTLLQLLSSLPIILHGKRIVCSFPNWAVYRTTSGGAGHYTVDNIDPKLCTHLLYQFANIDKSSLNISIGDHAADINKKGYKKSVALKTQNPQLKVMITVMFANDGIENAQNGHYEQLTANESNIVPFVSSAMDFLQLHNFDGLDLDISYEGHLPNDVVKTSFVHLLTELRKAFNTKGYILCLTLSEDSSDYSESNGEKFDVSGLNEIVDFINLETFSYHVPSRDPTVAPVADHHSPLRKRHFEMENENLNAEYSVTYWTNLGLLASKINLGIPLFGLSWTLARSQSSSNSFVPPISALGVGPAGDIMGVNNTMAFYEICSAVRNNGWKVFSDPTGKIGPYAVSPTDPKTWVGYDDPAMAIVKSQFILSEGLGGAFLLDISYDDFRDSCGLGVNPITTAIYNTLNGINTTCECICYND